MRNTHDNDNISYLYKFVKQCVETSKSFRDLFLNERTLNSDNFFSIGEKYIVFQNATISLSDIIKYILIHKTLDLQSFYEASKKVNSVENLIASFFWKYQTGTLIKILNKERTYLYEILAFFKERQRVDIDFNEKQFKYSITITYKHPEIRHPIFIMNYNQLLIKKTNEGIHRASMYFFKMFKDELKDEIEDPKKLNEEAKRLRDEFFRYFKIYETHRNGYIHVHMLASFPKQFTKDFKKMIEMLASWFETDKSGVDIKYINKNDRKKMKRYIKKQLQNQQTLRYTIDENDDIYYLLNINAFYLNDIKRLISYSKNCKVFVKKKKAQKIFRKRKLTNNEKDKILKEKAFNLISTERIQLKIDYVEYELVRRDVEKYKRLKERRQEYKELRKQEERRRTLDIIKGFIEDKINIIDSVILHNRYDKLKTVIKALDRLNNDKEIKQKYLELIIQAETKLNTILLEIYTSLHEKPPDTLTQEEDDWIDF